MTIGETIKRYRKLAGYTQKELAALLNISPSAVADYESGAKIPKIEMRQRFADVLGADILTLAGIELDKLNELRLLRRLLIKYADVIALSKDHKNLTAVLPAGAFLSLPHTKEKIENGSGDEKALYAFMEEMWPKYEPPVRQDGEEESVYLERLKALRQKIFLDYDRMEIDKNET